MKNLIIIALSIFCLFLGNELIKNKSELESVNSRLEAFGLHLAEWDSGEKLLFIHGIEDYSFGFAIDSNGKLFWNQISRNIPVKRTPFHNEPMSLSALGSCKNGKLAARPGDCESEIGFGAYRTQPYIKPIVNLFDYHYDKE